MTFYNKLVRDKIPELIRAGGETPHTRILEEEEFCRLLEEKLDEEVGEFHRDRNLEELADILEVVYALSEAYGGREALHSLYQKKHETRGGFRDKIYLIGKE